MSQNIDIFAETNPAYCAFVLWKFTKAYFQVSTVGVDFPLLWLPLPIVLSNDLRCTFDKTNKKTGFFSWLQRHPLLLIEVRSRIRDTSSFTHEAIKFGFGSGLLNLSTNGSVTSSANGLKNKPSFKANNEIGSIFVCAERLGHWMGDLKSPQTIIKSLGL